MRLKREQPRCTVNYQQQIFSNAAKDGSFSILQSGLRVTRGGRAEGRPAGPQSGHHPGCGPVLGDTRPPPSRVLTASNPLQPPPTPHAAVVLPQLFPFFITIFSAFHFPGQGGSQGAHLFPSCPLPCSQKRAHTCTRAHTLRTRPPQSPGGPWRAGTRSERDPPVSTPGT